MKCIKINAGIYHFHLPIIFYNAKHARAAKHSQAVDRLLLYFIKVHKSIKYFIPNKQNGIFVESV